MTDSFLKLVDRLTEPHKVWLDRDEGLVKVEQDGLLTQLRAAVLVGLETGGVGSAFGSRPPIDLAAADLLDEIDRQAAEAYASVHAGPVPYGTTESYVRLWAAATQETKLTKVSVRRQHPEKAKIIPLAYTELVEVSAYRLVSIWVEKIEDLFDPPSTREIRAACPACDNRYVNRLKDGQNVRSAALNFIRDRHGRTSAARCSACGVQWAPAQFEWLARHIGAAPLPELQHAEPIS